MWGCCSEANDIGGGAGLMDGIIATVGSPGGGDMNSPLSVEAEYWTVFGDARGKLGARPGRGGRYPKTGRGENKWKEPIKEMFQIEIIT